jgi:hypothetical protein
MKMPDYISRKKLKKKVVDRWENEGGKIAGDWKRLPESNIPPKRKRKKNRLGKSPDSASA